MATPTPATLDEFKEHLNKSLDASTEDSEIELMLEAATEACEGWSPKGRTAVGPIVVREFTERATAGSGLIILSNTPVQAVTAVTSVAAGTVYATEQLDVDGVAGIVQLVSGCLASGRYDVTYTAGRNPVPSSLKLATLIIGKHVWETQRGPRAGRLRGEDSETRAQWTGAGYLIPNRAATLLQPFTGVAVG